MIKTNTIINSISTSGSSSRMIVAVVVVVVAVCILIIFIVRIILVFLISIHSYWQLLLIICHAFYGCLYILVLLVLQLHSLPLVLPTTTTTTIESAEYYTTMIVTEDYTTIYILALRISIVSLTTD
jgi:hypothetical protein